MKVLTSGQRGAPAAPIAQSSPPAPSPVLHSIAGSVSADGCASWRPVVAAGSVLHGARRLFNGFFAAAIALIPTQHINIGSRVQSEGLGFGSSGFRVGVRGFERQGAVRATESRQHIAHWKVHMPQPSCMRPLQAASRCCGCHGCTPLSSHSDSCELLKVKVLTNAHTRQPGSCPGLCLHNVGAGCRSWTLSKRLSGMGMQHHLQCATEKKLWVTIRHHYVTWQSWCNGRCGNDTQYDAS